MADAIDLFLAAAAREPGRAAVARGDQNISYAELEDRARRVAGRVASRGAQKALIALPQGADAYAAMLGVGLAGGFYAPLNMAAPREKLGFIARQFEPDLIICKPGGEDVFAEDAPGVEAATLDGLLSSAPLTGSGRRHEWAYVIFTSGSTGRPKGVVIPRSALNHYVGWLGPAFEITPDDRVSQHPNIAFDLSVMDIYGALCHGATLHPILGNGDRLMPARVIAREKLTVWISVPSVVSLMTRARQDTRENLGSVRLFAFCGEPLLREHLDALFAACPSARVNNTYGPSETTVSMTLQRLTSRDYPEACPASAALGDTIPNMGLHLIGGHDADEGEIVITGPQLAVGYWRDPEATAKAFRPLEIDGRSTRGYFTGDRAKRIDGHTYFQGRIDFQVKVRGHRLELEETEAAIRALGWPRVCVVLWRDAVAAVIELPEGRKLDAEALRQRLLAKIESHAVPTVFRVIAGLPQNHNDKIDRGAVSDWLDRTEAAGAKPQVDALAEKASAREPSD